MEPAHCHAIDAARLAHGPLSGHPRGGGLGAAEELVCVECMRMTCTPPTPLSVKDNPHLRWCVPPSGPLLSPAEAHFSSREWECHGFPTTHRSLASIPLSVSEEGYTLCSSARSWACNMFPSPPRLMDAAPSVYTAGKECVTSHPSLSLSFARSAPRSHTIRPLSLTPCSQPLFHSSRCSTLPTCTDNFPPPHPRARWFQSRIHAP